MPLIRCNQNGKHVGWKWGESGKCFPTREETLRQARDTFTSQNKDGKSVEFEDGAKPVTKEQFND